MHTFLYQGDGIKKSKVSWKEEKRGLISIEEAKTRENTKTSKESQITVASNSIAT